PSHGSVSKVADGQETERLHLCAARSRPAAGVDCDFRERPLKFAKRAHASSVEWRLPRHSRVGSSSGSGVSCGGRSASGTCRRFTRIRVQVDDLPRMESTRTSSTASNLAAWGWLLFHLSRPASAAFLSGEFATITSGIFVRGFFAY